MGISRHLAFMATAALLSAPVISSAAPAAGDLAVTVSGTEAGKGAVRVNLYKSAESFLHSEDAQLEAAVPEEGEPRLVFEGLAPGTYAVVAYYDRNGNGTLDRGLFGVPLEPLGFSNGVVPVFSRPDFAEAAFAVEAGAQRIGITLRSFAQERQAGS